ncbi:MAG: EpsG family protein [Rubricoccaceae bacterium]
MREVRPGYAGARAAVRPTLADQASVSLESHLRLLAGLAFVVGFTLWFGYRDYSVGADTENYRRLFTWIAGSELSAILFRFRNTDTFFYALTKVVGSVVGVRGTFVFYAGLTVGAVALFARRLSRRAFVPMLALYATMPVFHALGTNVIRHGVAVALLLVGTLYLLNGRWKVATAWGVAAVFMHGSSVIYIAACVLAVFVPVRVLLGILVASSVLSFYDVGLHQVDRMLGLNLVDLLAKDRYDIYLSGSDRLYRVGFRADFFLYTLAPLGAAWLSLRVPLTRLVRVAPRKDFLVRMYLALASALFLAFSYPYSDRVGVFAWILIPAILLYREGQEERPSGFYIKAAAFAVIAGTNAVLLIVR